MEKLKRIYAEAVQNSGMPLYSFVQKVKAENGLARDEDIFLHWDAIREKYAGADAVREREKTE